MSGFLRLASVSRRLLPAGLFDLCRRLGILLLTPVRFSLAKGHARSALQQRAVTARGEALPWYTYPAIDFLRNQSFTGRHVLEFGAGQSSLWWSAHAGRVFSIESDPVWCATVRRGAPANLQVVLSPPEIPALPAEIASRRFDIIVIDGLRRQRAADLSIDLLKAGGCIILDNSEGEWGDRPGDYYIVRTFREAGFGRVDFIGFAPGNLREHCTSVFFRGRCFLFANPRPPAIPR
ncbi:MAG: hypothetical protein HY057_11315 [Rhodospirillales bacterium]|nr:hypothetical protein [Rhodospirillales bacterium]